MRLRKLKLKDAPLMLEWMHDDNVVHFMGTKFSKKTLHDCEMFITSSRNDIKNFHCAIVDEFDVYMGTVSLKNINTERSNAEFAITIRRQAMAKGYSYFGMNEMLKLGFKDLRLDEIYWYVRKDNIRAIRFYKKNGFKKMKNELNEIVKDIDKYEWYIIHNSEFLKINHRQDQMPN